MKSIKMSTEEMNTVWAALRTTTNEMTKAMEEYAGTERWKGFHDRYESCMKMMAKIENAMY